MTSSSRCATSSRSLVASWAECERHLERATQSNEALVTRVHNSRTGLEEQLVRHRLGHHFRRERCYPPRLTRLRYLGRPG
jgi:hypothetical protein